MHIETFCKGCKFPYHEPLPYHFSTTNYTNNPHISIHYYLSVTCSCNLPHTHHVASKEKILFYSLYGHNYMTNCLLIYISVITTLSLHVGYNFAITLRTFLHYSITVYITLGNSLNFFTMSFTYSYHDLTQILQKNMSDTCSKMIMTKPRGVPLFDPTSYFYLKTTNYNPLVVNNILQGSSNYYP